MAANSRKSWGLAAAGAMLTGAYYLYRENTAVDVEAIPVILKNLPPAFAGMKIAVVSDVHLPRCHLSPEKLAHLVELQRPDAIFLPGDLTNSYDDLDTRGLGELAGRLAAIAPCAAVPGNHEWRHGRIQDYVRILSRAGVRVLLDRATTLEREGQAVTVYGVGRRRPAALPEDRPRPILAIAHRPERLPYYAKAHWDLVVCGHAHGGQVRIGKQGLFAPEQGLLPRYVSGLYRQGETQMVVSRGLGNSSFPLRFGNRLHLPILILAGA